MIAAIVAAIVVSVGVAIAYLMPAQIIGPPEQIYGLRPLPSGNAIKLQGFLAGYRWFYYPPLAAAVLAGISVVSSLMFFGIGVILKKKHIQSVFTKVVLMLVSALASLEALQAFLISYELIFAFTWLASITVSLIACTVFIKYADPAAPDPYEDTPIHKKLDKKPPSDWAIENARRISQKD